MGFLRIDKVDFDRMSINLERFLNACDSLKLKEFTFFVAPNDVSADLLAFVPERTVNVEILFADVRSCTSSIVKIFAKLQNLKRLTEMDVTCNKLPIKLIKIIIDTSRKLESFEQLELGLVTISNDVHAKEMNNFSNIDIVRCHCRSKTPANLLDQITCFAFKA